MQNRTQDRTKRITATTLQTDMFYFGGMNLDEVRQLKKEAMKRGYEHLEQACRIIEKYRMNEEVSELSASGSLGSSGKARNSPHLEASEALE